MTFREWLKIQISRMVSVQSVTLGPHADLQIYNWSGVRVHLHLLDQVVKPRQLKRVLQEATDTGINSLFLVDARLLPADGERIPPSNWLLTLHSLGGERIFAYRVQNGVPEVIQIHLEPINGTDDYKAWHGPRIPFTQMRVYRKVLKQPRAIKGNWLVADFHCQDFWKSNDHRTYHQRARAGHRSDTTWQTWSGYQTTWRNNPATEERRSPIRTHLDNCYLLLGVDMGATREEIKAAYRKQAKTLHPDTSNLPQGEAAERFQALNAAYDYIKSANGW